MRNLCAMCFLVAFITGSIAQGASYQKIDGTIVDPILGYNNNPHPYSGPNIEPFMGYGQASLNNAKLSYADLTAARLTDFKLNYADLSNADLTSATVTSTQLVSADLTNANLTNAIFLEAVLHDVNLTNATLNGINGRLLIGTPSALPANWQLTGGFFIGPGAQLQHAPLVNLDLSYANLVGANLSYSFFLGSNLTNANLVGTDLTSAYYLDDSYGIAFYSATTLLPSSFDPVAKGWILIPEPTAFCLLMSGLLLLAGTRVRTPFCN